MMYAASPVPPMCFLRTSSAISSTITELVRQINPTPAFPYSHPSSFASNWEVD